MTPEMQALLSQRSLFTVVLFGTIGVFSESSVCLVFLLIYTGLVLVLRWTQFSAYATALFIAMTFSLILFFR